LRALNVCSPVHLYGEARNVAQEDFLSGLRPFQSVSASGGPCRHGVSDPNPPATAS